MSNCTMPTLVNVILVGCVCFPQKNGQSLPCIQRLYLHMSHMDQWLHPAWNPTMKFIDIRIYDHKRVSGQKSRFKNFVIIWILMPNRSIEQAKHYKIQIKINLVSFPNNYSMKM